MTVPLGYATAIRTIGTVVRYFCFSYLFVASDKFVPFSIYFPSFHTVAEAYQVMSVCMLLDISQSLTGYSVSP